MFGAHPKPALLTIDGRPFAKGQSYDEYFLYDRSGGDGKPAWRLYKPL